MKVQSRACNKCGGDLYWEEDTYDEYFKCLQCGHEQKEITMANEVFPGTSGKRHYTKGPKFYARRGRNVPEQGKPEPGLVAPMERSVEFWQGYRQAVLDGALK